MFFFKDKSVQSQHMKRKGQIHPSNAEVVWASDAKYERIKRRNNHVCFIRGTFLNPFD